MIIGIAVVGVITTIVILQTPHIQIKIEEVNDTYVAGTQIDFFVTADGYGEFCYGPEVSILDATNQSNVVWWGSYPAYTGRYCDPHQVEFTFHAGEQYVVTPQTNRPIIINKTGHYIIKASLGNAFSEKEFSVIPATTSHIIYHRYYSALTPQLEYFLKRGQNMTIPIGIYYSEQNAIHLTTFTHIHYCGNTAVRLPFTPANRDYQIPIGCNLDPGDAMPNPPDISAEIDKKSIDLPATATNETTVRDTTNLIISSSQDARAGVYRITIGLTDDNEFHGGRMVYFNVN